MAKAGTVQTTSTRASSAADCASTARLSPRPLYSTEPTCRAAQNSTGSCRSIGEKTHCTSKVNNGIGAPSTVFHFQALHLQFPIHCNQQAGRHTNCNRAILLWLASRISFSPAAFFTASSSSNPEKGQVELQRLYAPATDIKSCPIPYHSLFWSGDDNGNHRSPTTPSSSTQLRS